MKQFQSNVNHYLDKKIIESVFENREKGFEKSSGGFSPVVILNECAAVKSTPTERNLTQLNTVNAAQLVRKQQRFWTLLLSENLDPVWF